MKAGTPHHEPPPPGMEFPEAVAGTPTAERTPLSRLDHSYPLSVLATAFG